MVTGDVISSGGYAALTHFKTHKHAQFMRFSISQFILALELNNELDARLADVDDVTDYTHSKLQLSN